MDARAGEAVFAEGVKKAFPSTPLPLEKVSCVEPSSSTQSKKRLREAHGGTTDDTPLSTRSCRRSPRTPEIAPPPRIRPRRLVFDDGAHLTDSPKKQELKQERSTQAKRKASDIGDYPPIPSTPEQQELFSLKRRRQSPRLIEKVPSTETPIGKPLPYSRNKEPVTKKDKLSAKADRHCSKPSKSLKTKCLHYVVVDRTKLHVGDDVYLKRTEEDVDEEAEGCLVCGKTGKLVECDSCSGGVHLRCMDPPMKEVPEGDWYCSQCAAVKDQGTVPGFSNGAQQFRTARELLLAGKLWAARIERLWKGEDGSYWFKGRWYLIPEETAVGRQPHNLRRELFRTTQVDDNEVASILRQCYVMGPEDFRKSGREGDDVFLCEYEYDTQFQTFKRISDADESNGGSDDEFEGESEVEDHDEDSDGDGVSPKMKCSNQKALKPLTFTKAANRRMSNVVKVGAKMIPVSARRRALTPFEKAKDALRLTATPDSLPCREMEMQEISAFVTDAVAAGDQSLGHCLYISGVPGTGKTATVLEVMRSIKKSFEDKSCGSYRFVEINGLRLTSPEHLYTVLHEALTGHHLGWKKALHLLDERFSNPKPSRRIDARPCILLIDELDLLVTRNQSVLYNIFDWPTRPHSRLFVIGIANTIDLPERLLPRIASRMGLHRVSFSPYSHEQLQRIISCRLTAIDAFEKQAIEFASRKVAAVSGDARRALELCRRAVEIAEARCINNHTAAKSRALSASQAKANLVGMKDVEEAIKEMFQAPHIKIMRRCSKHAKLFLVSMVYEQCKTGMVETNFEKVATAYTFLCRNNNESPLDWDTLLSVGCGLGAGRLILCEPGARHRLQKLQLNFPIDDVSFALKEDTEVPWIGKYI